MCCYNPRFGCKCMASNLSTFWRFALQFVSTLFVRSKSKTRRTTTKKRTRTKKQQKNKNHCESKVSPCPGTQLRHSSPGRTRTRDRSTSAYISNHASEITNTGQQLFNSVWPGTIEMCVYRVIGQVYKMKNI